MSKTVAGMIGLLCGVVSAILMSTRHFFIRKYSGTYAALPLGIDSSIVQTAVFSIFSLVIVGTENTPISPTTGLPFRWNWKDFAIGVVGGVIMDFGKVAMGEAVNFG